LLLSVLRLADVDLRTAVRRRRALGRQRPMGLLDDAVAAGGAEPFTRSRLRAGDGLPDASDVGVNLRDGLGAGPRGPERAADGGAARRGVSDTGRRVAGVTALARPQGAERARPAPLASAH